MGIGKKEVSRYELFFTYETSFYGSTILTVEQMGNIVRYFYLAPPPAHEREITQFYSQSK
jgi:hypothetical protein